MEDDEKDNVDTIEKDTMSVEIQDKTQEDHNEVTVIKSEHDQKMNHNGCVPFEDQKQWCSQGKGTLVHIFQLKSPQVTLCGM